MTAEERYLMIREQSNVFTNKNMLKHHLILHLKEAYDEGFENGKNSDGQIPTL